MKMLLKRIVEIPLYLKNGRIDIRVTPQQVTNEKLLQDKTIIISGGEWYRKSHRHKVLQLGGRCSDHWSKSEKITGCV